MLTFHVNTIEELQTLIDFLKPLVDYNPKTRWFPRYFTTPPEYTPPLWVSINKKTLNIKHQQLHSKCGEKYHTTNTTLQALLNHDHAEIFI